MSYIRRVVVKEPTGTRPRTTEGRGNSSNRQSVEIYSWAIRPQEVVGHRQGTIQIVMVPSEEACRSYVLALSPLMHHTLDLYPRIYDCMNLASMNWPPGTRIIEAVANRIIPMYYDPTQRFPKKILVHFSYENDKVFIDEVFERALEVDINTTFFVKHRGWASVIPSNQYNWKSKQFKVRDIFLIIQHSQARSNEQSLEIDQDSFDRPPERNHLNQNVEKDGKTASHNRKTKIEGDVAGCSSQNSKKDGDNASPIVISDDSDDSDSDLNETIRHRIIDLDEDLRRNVLMNWITDSDSD